MINSFIRGNKIWINYYLNDKRIRKSTGLNNNLTNLRMVNNKLIPQILLKIRTGEIYKKKPKTFNYYADIFLIHKEKKTKVFLDRLPYYERVIKYFDNIDIDRISRLDIKNYLLSLDMKNNSKRIYKSTLSEIFELAVDDNILNYNPALNIKLEKDEKTNIDYFSKDEVNLLLSNAKGIIKPYLLIAFNTGLRPEEILGLQLIDIKNNSIEIKRVRTKGRIDTPKTNNSFRTVPCPNYVIEEIKNINNKSFFIFGDINDASRLRHQWARVLKDSNIEHKKLYSTRHTFATLMLKDNIVSINELAGLLGHSSARVTLTHYASVIDTKLIKFDSDFNLYCHDLGTIKKNKF